jgi:formate-dependent phosphoribosylglycinamide formyltransferase (GAR transformylase)
MMPVSHRPTGIVTFRQESLMHFEIWWVFVFGLGITALQTVQRIAVAIIERRKSALPPVLNDLAEKVERISQAVEATAIEVERIGESQRFLTRVLGDGQPTARQRAGPPFESTRGPLGQ